MAGDSHPIQVEVARKPRVVNLHPAQLVQHEPRVGYPNGSDRTAVGLLLLVTGIRWFVLTAKAGVTERGNLAVGENSDGDAVGGIDERDDIAPTGKVFDRACVLDWSRADAGEEEYNRELGCRNRQIRVRMRMNQSRRCGWHVQFASEKTGHLFF